MIFYSVYSSKACKESIDKLMYGMTLTEFIDYQNYVDIQNCIELAIHKDQEIEMKRNKDGRKQ